ncbi:hypothetical protein [Actinoplanes awajinensis]|uniref:Uncharacterized protein n=1 Tax=Actinoplanes awajinensis subsp. mycoplanecinus TaxID=135947 RepID=A0A101JDI3_9ACTN|nr:hypothetical protein [Actinoplanes awajinensis]KUL24829.1 hypothetical protein ADL15_41780 [Actinoplanes awajinensis subsp. mycoplanecinus]
MTNLREQFEALAGSPAAPTTAQTDADLARGRGALRRRRALQAATGSAFAIVVAAAAVAFTTTSTPAPSTPQAAGPTATTAATTGVTASAAFALVAYKGEQPAGFSIDKVPAGWEVQGLDENLLTLAPEGAKPRNSAEPQGDQADTDPYSFVGKVVVTLQSLDEQGTPAGEAVKVGGKKATLVKKEGAKDGRTLYVAQPSGVNLQIQVWDGIGWSADQIVEFAEGIHVNPNAKQGRG